MGLEISITTLVSAVFVLLVLYVIIRNLRMPPSFFDQQRQREQLRRKFLKSQIIPPDDLPVEEES